MRENVARTEEEVLTPEHQKQWKGMYMPNRVTFSRIFRIMREFVVGFNLLKKYCLTATIFGTSRCSFEDDVYQEAQKLAGLLAADGFTIITGGGYGVMQAASRGASEAGGEAVGLTIELPYEQQASKYLSVSRKFHYFFIRKVMLSFASEVYIFFPGGFGTLDEFFEIVLLIQTKKIQPIPVILIGREYWAPLLSWIQTILYEKNHAIDKENMDIYYLVDSVEEAHTRIKKLVPIEELRAC